MPASVILTIIAPVAAVIGILLAVSAATGGRRTTRIVAADDVHQAIRDADMSFDPGKICISADARTALIADAHGSAVAIAYVVGDRIAARTLRSSDVRGVRWINDADGTVSLRLHFTDFGCPELIVRLTRDDATRWRRNVDALSQDDAVRVVT